MGHELHPVGGRRFGDIKAALQLNQHLIVGQDWVLRSIPFLLIPLAMPPCLMVRCMHAHIMELSLVLLTEISSVWAQLHVACLNRYFTRVHCQISAVL